MLDALYSNASARLLSRRTLLDLAVSTIYITIHSLVLYFQVVALNVAINSSNSALVSLLISNNFVELKSSVFKKYSHINLFQISASGRCRMCVRLTSLAHSSHQISSSASNSSSM